MQIPTVFLDKIEEEVPETAILRGPLGCTWHVKVCQKDAGVFLTDGWETFLVHHSLVSEVSCLNFRYCGNWCFEVDIFAASGLEKEFVDAGGDDEHGPSGVNNKRVEEDNKHVGTLNNKRPKYPLPIPDGSSSLHGASDFNGIPDRARTTWDLELLSHYLDTCLEEAAKERTASGNLTRDSWQNVVSVLTEKTNMQFTTMQLLNKWNALRRDYIVWSEIIAEAKDWEYDPVANKINWSQKQWKEYIKVNPCAKDFRNKSLAYPEKMKLLFGCYVESRKN